MNTLTRRSSLIDSIAPETAEGRVIPMPRKHVAATKEWTIWAQHARRTSAAERRTAARRAA